MRMSASQNNGTGCSSRAFHGCQVRLRTSILFAEIKSSLDRIPLWLKGCELLSFLSLEDIKLQNLVFSVTTLRPRDVFCILLHYL